MPRRFASVALLLAPMLALTGCGSDSGGDAETADLPAVSGGFGEKPTVEVPEAEPSAELVVEVLEEGDGEQVQSGDLLVADYQGQTWKPGEDGPNIFDSSFERGQPAGFPIGVGNVIKGWDEGLVGKTEGSRVLLVVPPDKGYGEQGTPDGSIPAGSTLVFVVDVIDTVSGDTPVSGTPVQKLPAGLPVVTGEGGAKAPALKVAKDTPPPKTSTSVVVLEGDGQPLGDQVVANVLQAPLKTGKVDYSSWEQGSPVLIPVQQIPGLAKALSGQKVGTRAVALISAKDNANQEGKPGEPLVLVLDIIGTVPAAEDAASE